MRKKLYAQAQTAQRRRRAEALVRKQHPATVWPRTDADTKRLVHELQVHQIELEMQNAELQAARDNLEVALEKYTDLYDFAPVGYLAIDEAGLILEANLAGASMLGVERSRLIHRRWQGFVVPASRPILSAFLERVLAGGGNQICEVSFLKAGGAPFWADLHARSAGYLRGARRWCRVAVSDITALKRAEEAQRRMEDLTAANRQLQQEIVRRQAVETALNKSDAQQRQLLVESSEMQEQLRRLSHQVLQAQEEERKRISRDLHDQVAQALVGINVHLTALAQQATVNPKGLKQKIARTQRLVEESVDIVHQFARELRPTLLDDLGLVPALHSFMKDFTKRTGIHIAFTSFTAARIAGLDSVKSTVLFRVAQEALINVSRHADASHVRISIRKIPAAIQLEVTDDGKGFDVERVLFPNAQRRLGVIGMRERVQMMGGQYSLESAPGKGTTVRAEIPLVAQQS